jgi:imidazolonepropionase-like amidohydrolase
LASRDADTLFKTFATNHTAITPVLGTLEWMLHLSAPGSVTDPNSKYIAYSLKKTAVNIKAEDLAMLKRELPELRSTVGKMHNDGVMLLAGTDIAGARLPGFSLHGELLEFVYAGLSPFEALQTATINPAIVLGVEKNYGTIESGKIANLVLLDADPLKDIANTQKIAGVVLKGKFINRLELKKMLGEAEQLAKRE